MAKNVNDRPAKNQNEETSQEELRRIARENMPRRKMTPEEIATDTAIHEELMDHGDVLPDDVLESLRAEARRKGLWVGLVQR